LAKLRDKVAQLCCANNSREANNDTLNYKAKTLLSKQHCEDLYSQVQKC